MFFIPQIVNYKNKIRQSHNLSTNMLTQDDKIIFNLIFVTPMHVLILTTVSLAFQHHQHTLVLT